MNSITVFVCLVLAALVVLAVRQLHRKKKQGFCACGDCSTCGGCKKKEVRQ